MLNSKFLAYVLLTIFGIVAFFTFLTPTKKYRPVQLKLKNEVVGITTEIQEIAPLIYFKCRYENKHRFSLDWDADRFFKNMLDELSWLSRKMVKNNDDAQKFFELTLAARYAQTASEWLDKENLPDTERCLKAAREHLQKAKEVHQLQEKRKNERSR